MASHSRKIKRTKKNKSRRLKLRGGFWPFSPKANISKLEGKNFEKVAHPQKDGAIVSFFTKFINRGKNFMRLLIDFGKLLIKILEKEQMTGTLNKSVPEIPEHLRSVVEWAGIFSQTANQNREEINKYKDTTVKSKIKTFLEKILPIPSEIKLPRSFAEHYAELSVAKRSIQLPGNKRAAVLSGAPADLQTLAQRARTEMEEEKTAAAFASTTGGGDSPSFMNPLRAAAQKVFNPLRQVTARQKEEPAAVQKVFNPLRQVTARQEEEPAAVKSQAQVAPDENVTEIAPVLQGEIEDNVEKADSMLIEHHILEAILNPPDITKLPSSMGNSAVQDDSRYESFIGKNNLIDLILDRFNERYNYNKLHNPTRNGKTARLAHNLAIVILSLKGLMNAGSLSVTVLTGLTTFGLAGGLVYTIIKNLSDIVSKKETVDLYLNSTDDALNLMSPHKLWKDPYLKLFIPKLINIIRGNPSLLIGLPGFAVEIANDSVGKQTFKVFLDQTTENPSDNCIDSSKILNLIFIKDLSEQPAIINFISEELQGILVTSAHFKKNASSSFISKALRGVGKVMVSG